MHRAAHPLWWLHGACNGPAFMDWSHPFCVALMAAFKELPVQAITEGGMLLSALAQGVVVLVKQVGPCNQISNPVHLRLKTRVYELLSLRAPPNIGYRVLWCIVESRIEPQGPPRRAPMAQKYRGPRCEKQKGRVGNQYRFNRGHACRGRDGALPLHTVVANVNLPLEEALTSPTFVSVDGHPERHSVRSADEHLNRGVKLLALADSEYHALQRHTHVRSLERRGGEVSWGAPEDGEPSGLMR